MAPLPRHRFAASCASCGLAIAVAIAGTPARAAKIDASLREAVHGVPVASAGESIVVTSFRPPGEGPFPWIVLSHGTATTPEANRALGRYRPMNAVREWVNRGYAVFVPVRRGHGVFPSREGTPLRTAATTNFFRSQDLPLPFPATAGRGSGW